MIFPWACQSQNSTSNYSKNMLKCFTSPIEYISVNSETEIYSKFI